MFYLSLMGIHSRYERFDQVISSWQQPDRCLKPQNNKVMRIKYLEHCNVLFKSSNSSRRIIVLKT